MNSRITGKELLMVGSVPFETSEEVVRAVSASGIAEALPCIPSGEVGGSAGSSSSAIAYTTAIRISRPCIGLRR